MSATPQTNSLDFAIVIGLSEFKDWPVHACANTDARAFAEWLVNPRGGQLPPENITLLLSDEPATFRPYETLSAGFNAWAVQARKRIAGARRLYMYFAGYGAAGFGVPSGHSRDDVFASSDSPHKTNTIRRSLS